MYDGSIYCMHQSLEDNYPRIYWSSHRNKPIDWVRVHGMFTSEVPLDEDYTSGVDIHVVMKGRVVDVIDCQLCMLVTPRTRSCLESTGAGGIRFIPVKINGERWWCLVVDRKIDCLNWERCNIEYLDEIERKFPVIHKYVFKRDYIMDPALFRIAGRDSLEVFITESIKQAMTVAGLKGFEFVDFENPPEGYLMS